MPDKKAPTRNDVAKRAGVSTTIVSYVLNNNRYVAQEKRERVLAAVRELHYRPNTVARALKGKKSNHILFIADDISNEHFGKIVEEMDKIAYDKGYLISLLADRNDAEFVAQVNSRQVDGIVISSVSFDEKYVLDLIHSGVPVVLLMNRNYQLAGQYAGRIYTGLEQGMKNCVKLLLGMGRKNLLYIDRISCHSHFSTQEDLRFHAFCEQIQESRLDFSPERFVSGCKTEKELFETVCKLIHNGLAVDGIVGRNDNMACIAMTAAISCGKQIPHDIAVIGFDNSRMSSYVTPALTSMEIDRPAIARAIITMLDDMISGKAPSVQSFPTKLIERESTVNIAPCLHYSR